MHELADHTVLYSSSGAAGSEKLKKNNLAGCRQCKAGNQITQFHAALCTRAEGGQLSLSHPTRESPETFMEEEWPQLRARRAPGPGGSSKCFSKGPCTDLTWTSLCGSPVRCTLQNLRAFHRSLLAIWNAKWIHRGLSAKEKAFDGTMRRSSTELRESQKCIRLVGPNNTKFRTQDFYFCLHTRQKIALCESCGMTKLENKLYGGFGWHSCLSRLCISFAFVKAKLVLIRRIIIFVEDDRWAERLFILP